jgi:hypothetical protein
LPEDAFGCRQTEQKEKSVNSAVTKIGRNSPCPCGSGKKYKRCCQAKETSIRQTPLPQGRFQYEPGSYGGPGGYVPSIMCYQQQGENSRAEHFCLVKPSAIFDEEDSASEHASNDLSEARTAMDAEGSVHDFALLLRHKGYKSVSDFRVVKDHQTSRSTGDSGLPGLAASFSSAPDALDSVNLDKRESMPITDEKIEQVSRVLSEWNPLGDRADTIPDLDGYRIEAADILRTLNLFNLFGSANPAATIQVVLNQAFEISLGIDECRDAASRIAAIYKTL